MCVPSAFVLLSSCDEHLPCVFLLLQFFRARGTDIAFLKAYKPVRAAAEYTRAAEFMKNDVVAVYIYLKRVLLRDVKSAAHLYWQHDSSQFVNFAHDSCRFHCSSLPKILLSGHDVVFRKGRIYPHIRWHFIFLCLKNQWKHFVVWFRKHKIVSNDTHVYLSAFVPFGQICSLFGCLYKYIHRYYPIFVN